MQNSQRIYLSWDVLKIKWFLTSFLDLFSSALSQMEITVNYPLSELYLSETETLENCSKLTTFC